VGLSKLGTPVIRAFVLPHSSALSERFAAAIPPTGTGAGTAGKKEPNSVEVSIATDRCRNMLLQIIGRYLSVMTKLPSVVSHHVVSATVLPHVSRGTGRDFAKSGVSRAEIDTKSKKRYIYCCHPWGLLYDIID
jgi:hypothetical protein